MLQVDLANASDSDLRKFAYKKASVDLQDKKNRRIDNALFYSIPLASGLSSAVKDVNIYPKDLFELQQKGFSKETISSAVADIANEGKIVMDPSRVRSIRLARFGTSALSMGVGIAIFNAVYNIRSFASKNFQSVKDFTEKHPIISSIGTLAAGIGALSLASIGANKLLMKHADKLFDSYGVIKTPAKLDKFLAENKILNTSAKYIDKIPSSIKEFTKSILGWGPLALAFTYLCHGAKHNSKMTNEYINNYVELKNNQQAYYDIAV
ncbi:hypothetical protein J6G99_02180 [bacterium]|nr:hypothetical protein [bacterium]